MSNLLEQLCPSWCTLRARHEGPHRPTGQNDNHRTGCGCPTCGPPRQPRDFNTGDLEERRIAELEDLCRRAANLIEAMAHRPHAVSLPAALDLVERLRRGA